MDNIFIVTIAKSIAVFILALFLTKLMGRKVISQITFFDFITGISMGSIITYAVTSSGKSSLVAVVALIMFTILEKLIGYIQLKSPVIRKFVNSEPSTLVENGNILEPNMKNVKLPINDLMMKLRKKSVFNLADVEFAVLEPDGELSVLLKSEKKPATPQDLNIKTAKSSLTKDVIIDGDILEENLKSVGLDEKWLKSQLNSHGIKNASQVFYAGLDNNKTLHISKKNNSIERKNWDY